MTRRKRLAALSYGDKARLLDKLRECSLEIERAGVRRKLEPKHDPTQSKES